ncbi:MAG: dihydrodipicolinate synthase family protein [Chloroflexota bacterium]|nr:dihydrodipicolinate synthase family protein [Chloroflexota bacterium]MDE2949397.1 dihydrodipicolinate synthase family protein [Chloroflexota bacterium]
MTIEKPALLDGLNSVIGIPLIPFSGGQIDYAGHAKNIDYLMKNNHLSENRPRVISIAGTSLVHHVAIDDQIKLLDIAGRGMDGEGILMAAIVPNPLPAAADLITQLAALQRPPDIYLIMPLSGTYGPAGLYESFMNFAETQANRYGARFLYYYRRPRDRDMIIRLLLDSPHFVGVKIGTNEDDVLPFVEALDEGKKIVIWGIGDRSTAAAEMGAKGHTSGINIVAARASDAINNAQRRRDYEAARQIEDEISPLEDIRFMLERAYNYSAVMAAINCAGFDDVVGGGGGPFNPPVPPDIARQIERIMASIEHYH